LLDVAATKTGDAIIASGKYLLENGGKSAAKQDADDQSGRTVQEVMAKKAAEQSAPYENTPENQERMKQGKAPVGKDGHPVELHHDGQKPDSPLDEKTRTDHRGGDNFKKNHPNTGQGAKPN
jgi:hypothetical protein